MSKIAIALRKASEQYDSQKIADIRHCQFAESLLEQIKNKSVTKTSWLRWVFVSCLILTGLIILTSQLDEQGISLDGKLTRSNMNLQPMKSYTSLKAKANKQAEDKSNLKASAQQGIAGNVSSQEQSPPDRKQDPLPVYTIQVGSFQNRNNAEATRSRLREMAYSTVIVTKVLRAKITWYRVYVGEFRDKRQAQDTLTKLQKDYVGSFVIKTERG